MVGHARGLVRWCGLATLAFATGCGADGDLGVDDDGPTGSVMVELTTSPGDALCHKALFEGMGSSFVRSFDVAAGTTSTQAIDNLPTGTFSLTFTAYSATCATLASNAAPTWSAPPVSVTLMPGVVTGVTISLRRTPSTSAVLDYDTGVTVYTATGPVRALAVNGTTLYVADTSQIVRLPEVGGGATTVATSANITAIGADANNLVWGGTGLTMSRAPAMGFGVPRPLISTYATMMTVVGSTAVTLDVSTVRLVPFNLPTPTSATTVLATSMNLVTADSSQAFFSAGGALYRQSLSYTGPVAPIFMASTPSGEDVLSMAADGTNVFVVSQEGLRKIPVAGTTFTTMLSYFRAPVAQVAIDASNVYFVTSAVSGSCIGSTLSRVAKSGTMATPLWSRAGLCPNRLVLSTNGVFLADTASNWVIRVPK